MPDLETVFHQLRAILEPYADRLDAKHDTESNLYVDTRYVQKNGKPLFFGAVQVKKNYVSYHLMPVYTDPLLLKGVSSRLRRRMQGKSCFNFSAKDPTLFRELAKLTKAAFAKYRERGFV